MTAPGACLPVAWEPPSYWRPGDLAQWLDVWLWLAQRRGPLVVTVLREHVDRGETRRVLEALAARGSTVDSEVTEPPPEPRLSVAPDGAVTVAGSPMGNLLRGRVAGVPVPGLRDPSKRALVMLSGCSWSCSGGGQRPVALSRALADLGVEVAYYSTVPQLTEVAYQSAATVTTFTKAAWAQLLRWAEGPPGWVVTTLAPYFTGCRELAARGWAICYDLLDDWDAFAQYADLWPGAIDDEGALIAQARAVTCSAPVLVERAARFGRPDAVLIRNGGPVSPIPRGDVPEDFERGDPAAVYCGYLQGSWFDWQPLMQLGEAGIATTVVGNIITDPEIAHVRFVGEKPYPEAMRYVAAADVGLIPFKHLEICRAVDPIKAYDYWAAGLWTVATPQMEALRGRPFVLFAKPEDFPAAVQEAAERRETEAPDAAFVAANSWAERAKALSAVLWPEAAADDEALREREAESARERSRRHGLPPEAAGAVAESDCALRCTWQAPIRCNMSPPCPYCNNAAERARKPQDMPGTAKEWLAGFEGLSAQVGGPLYLSVCYGEPLADPKVVEVAARLAERHKLDLVTNLLAPVSTLGPFPRNGNVALCVSYHPHAWESPEAFLRKLREVERSGLRCGTVQVVAWPPYLPQLEEWASLFAGEGFAFGVLPFWGEWEGRAYPDAYPGGTERWQAAPATGRCGDRWQGKPCWAGARYVYIGHTGETWRCVMPSPGLGNLLAGEVRLATEPEPCPSERCPCPDLWQWQCVP